MNPNLEAALVDLLSTVKDVKEFTLEQAPEVLQQLLTLHLIESIVYLIAGILMCVFGAFCVKPFIKHFKDDNPSGMFHFIVIAVGVLFGIPMVFLHALNAISIIVAPKLYILEYIAKML